MVEWLEYTYPHLVVICILRVFVLNNTAIPAEQRSCRFGVDSNGLPIRLSVDASVCFCAETDNTHESDRTTVMKNFFIALYFLVVYCNKTFNPSATCIA